LLQAYVGYHTVPNTNTQAALAIAQDTERSEAEDTESTDSNGFNENVLVELAEFLAASGIGNKGNARWDLLEELAPMVKGYVAQFKWFHYCRRKTDLVVPTQQF
jgi:hypothetical protein